MTTTSYQDFDGQERAMRASFAQQTGQTEVESSSRPHNTSILGATSLHAPANNRVRANLMQGMQQTHGNRAFQRFVQRTSIVSPVEERLVETMKRIVELRNRPPEGPDGGLSGGPGGLLDSGLFGKLGRTIGGALGSLSGLFDVPGGSGGSSVVVPTAFEPNMNHTTGEPVLGGGEGSLKDTHIPITGIGSDGRPRIDNPSGPDGEERGLLGGVSRTIEGIFPGGKGGQSSGPLSWLSGAASKAVDWVGKGASKVSEAAGEVAGGVGMQPFPKIPEVKPESDIPPFTPWNPYMLPPELEPSAPPFTPFNPYMRPDDDPFSSPWVIH